MFLPNRHNLWFRLLFALATMALFVLGYQWGNQHRQGATGPLQIGGVLIQPPGEIPDFSFKDPFGRPVARTDLDAGWTLLAFGDLADASGQRAVRRLIDVNNRLADQRGLLEKLGLVLITGDGNSTLARDFARLSPALRLLGGTPDEIAPLRDALGLPTQDSPTLFVIAPGGHLLALFPETQDGGAMAEDLKAILANAHTLLPETP
ncbi:SCO family protein [Thiocystis violacea]|uniref:SCO family protein n=1 Tax=Thiocystis violacea TaxID=13725 RepID=UPI00190832E0|nr:hypothetical protein [Thiocystis violacea]MBK1717068.1 hypothetical protein [Thiocystis violacea]